MQYLCIKDTYQSCDSPMPYKFTAGLIYLFIPERPYKYILIQTLGKTKVTIYTARLRLCFIPIPNEENT